MRGADERLSKNGSGRSAPGDQNLAQPWGSASSEGNEGYKATEGFAPVRGEERDETARGPAVQDLPANESDHADDKSHLFVFTNAKAGMDSVDREKANKIIYEMSKNSAHFKHAQEQDKKVDERLHRMRIKMKSWNMERQVSSEAQLQATVAETERQRELGRVWVVVDMDMFYAAVEMRDDPSLINKPLAVGGMGMICTTNYEARKFGVRAAMPGFIGKALCPSLVFVKPCFEKYTVVAQQTREIFAEFDPNFSAVSLDEAYLDITDYYLKHKADIKTRLETQQPGDSGLERFWGRSKLFGMHEDEKKMKEETCTSGGGSQTMKSDRGRTIHDFELELETQHSPPPSTGEDDASDSTDELDKDEQGFARPNNHGDDEKRHVSPPALCVEKDVSGAKMDTGQARAAEVDVSVVAVIVADIRKRIFEKTRLTASAGVACNPMLAKVCSDMNKPDGHFLLPFNRKAVVTFMRDLPARKVGGIGKVTEKILAGLGVTTCGEMFDSRALIFYLFTRHTAQWLLRISMGIADAHRKKEESSVGRKSISCERTFSAETHLPGMMLKCRDVADKLAADLRKRQLRAKHLTVKLKTAQFAVTTKAVPLQTFTDDADVIFEAAARVLRECPPPSLRLLGLRMAIFEQERWDSVPKGQRTLVGFFDKGCRRKGADRAGNSQEPLHSSGEEEEEPKEERKGELKQQRQQSPLEKEKQMEEEKVDSNPGQAQAVGASSDEGSDGVSSERLRQAWSKHWGTEGEDMSEGFAGRRPRRLVHVSSNGHGEDYLRCPDREQSPQEGGERPSRRRRDSAKEAQSGVQTSVARLLRESVSKPGALEVDLAPEGGTGGTFIPPSSFSSASSVAASSSSSSSPRLQAGHTGHDCGALATWVVDHGWADGRGRGGLAAELGLGDRRRKTKASSNIEAFLPTSLVPPMIQGKVLGEALSSTWSAPLISPGGIATTATATAKAEQTSNLLSPSSSLSSLLATLEAPDVPPPTPLSTASPRLRARTACTAAAAVSLAAAHERGLETTPTSGAPLCGASAMKISPAAKEEPPSSYRARGRKRLRGQSRGGHRRSSAESRESQVLRGWVEQKAGSCKLPRVEKATDSHARSGGLQAELWRPQKAPWAVSCPVCGGSLRWEDDLDAAALNRRINRHVDQCLTRNAL